MFNIHASNAPLFVHPVSPASIPQIILNDVFKPPSDEFGISLYMGAFNTIFLYIMVSVAYGMVRKARLQHGAHGFT